MRCPSLRSKRPIASGSSVMSIGSLQQVRTGFRNQGILRLLRARISRLEKGLVEISTDNRPEFGQQDGFVSAGVIATLADNAGGYAALSLLAPGSRCLTVEFKINFTRPGVGDAIRGRGSVRKLGRKIALCEIEVEMYQGGRWISCAWGSQTVYLIRGKRKRLTRTLRN